MTGVDRLLAGSLEKTVRENLGEMTIHKIQNRLFEKYGISITESMQEFEKLDYVLREFFDAGAEGLEKKFLERICSVKSRKNTEQKRFEMTEPSITQAILKAYGDEDASKMLNSAIDEPFTISEILEKCQIPQTSGYRKINLLVEEGLLIEDGFIIMPSGKRVSTYRSLFDNVEINVINNIVSISVQFTQRVFEKSSILQTVYSA